MKLVDVSHGLVNEYYGEIPLAHQLLPAGCLSQAFSAISLEAFVPDAVTGKKLCVTTVH